MDNEDYAFAYGAILGLIAGVVIIGLVSIPV